MRSNRSGSRLAPIGERRLAQVAVRQPCSDCRSRTTRRSVVASDATSLLAQLSATRTAAPAERVVSTRAGALPWSTAAQNGGGGVTQTLKGWPEARPVTRQLPSAALTVRAHGRKAPSQATISQPAT